VNIRTIERYLLLAGDLPGLKFKNSLKPHPTKVGAAILVVEVTQKPVDMFNRVDNRGTHARGPLEYLTSITATTGCACTRRSRWTYAGAFPEPRAAVLQRHLPAGAQRRRPDLFSPMPAMASDTPTSAVTRISCSTHTRSLYLESGLSYPIIRARERNLSIAALTFGTEDRGIFFDLRERRRVRSIACAAFAFAWTADSADSSGASTSSSSSSARHRGPRAGTQNGSDLASRFNGRVDFTKMELTVSRLQPLFDQFSVLARSTGNMRSRRCWYRNSAAMAGALFGRAFDPSQFVSDSCLELLAELRYDIPFN